MTLTIKLDGNWSSFQLANSTPPQSVIDRAIAPSARMPRSPRARYLAIQARERGARIAGYCGNFAFLQKFRTRISAPLSRQPLVKGERLVRYEVNAVMQNFEAIGFLWFANVVYGELQFVDPTRDWSQTALACNLSMEAIWIPFGDHPLKLERYRED